MTIREVMAESLKQTSRDLAAAVSVARERIEGDRDLYLELAVPLIEAALDDAGREILNRERRTIWPTHSAVDRPAADSGESKASAVLRQGLRAVAAMNLMDYPLRNGKRLGDATRAEVKRDAEMLLLSGRSHLLRGHWLRLVGQALKRDDQIVGDVLTEGRLQGLKKMAEKKVA